MNRNSTIVGPVVRRGGIVALAFTAGTVAAAVVLGGRGPAIAQEMGETQMPPEMQEAYAAYLELQQPGEHHERLASWLGEWDCEVNVMMDPAAPPVQSRGSATFSWLHEGRWLKQEFRGEMMGEPFTGFGISGYDNYRKQYVDMWVDSMSTSMMTMRGSTMPGSDVIAMFGEMDEPMTGEIGKTVRNIITFHSDDHATFEMQEVMYGEPFTVMRIEYRRRK
jgi:hypothetical protein